MGIANGSIVQADARPACGGTGYLDTGIANSEELMLVSHSGGGKDEGACHWPDEGLDQIVDMVDSRDFIGQKFYDDQNAQQDDDPGVGKRIVGRGKFKPIGIVGDDRDRKKRNVSVQPGAC